MGCTTTGCRKLVKVQKRPLSSTRARRTACFSVSSISRYMSFTSCIALSSCGWRSPRPKGGDREHNGKEGGKGRGMKQWRIDRMKKWQMNQTKQQVEWKNEKNVIKRKKEKDNQKKKSENNKRRQNTREYTALDENHSLFQPPTIQT